MTASPCVAAKGDRRRVLIAVILCLSGTASAADAQERERGQVLPVSEALCQSMKARGVLTASAPVGCERLNLVKFSYVGFDGQVHDSGEIVVMDAAAPHVLRLFGQLRAAKFPIAKARLMNEYGGNDDRSMEDNNTSAFNARQITGGGALSLHAYGLAIDINPKQNPYAKREGASLKISPRSAIDYTNRLNIRPWKAARPGMAESVIDIFANNGFVIWGGYWDDPIDYQHFQVSRALAEQLARSPPAAARALFAERVNRYLKCRQGARTGDPSSRIRCIVANESAADNAD